MRPYSPRRVTTLGVGILMLLQSACGGAGARPSVCQHDLLDLVVVPVTSACEKKMKRLAGQLTECEKQWSWRAEQMSQVNRVDKVIGDLSVGQRVAWLVEKNACDDINKSCFFALQCP